MLHLAGMDTKFTWASESSHHISHYGQAYVFKIIMCNTYGHHVCQVILRQSINLKPSLAAVFNIHKLMKASVSSIAVTTQKLDWNRMGSVACVRWLWYYYDYINFNRFY